MRTVILHVGMHKTGTTSIQHSLQGFSGGRVRYADLGNPNHSGPISAAFSDRLDRDGLQWRRGRSVEKLEELRKSTLARLREELALQDFDKFIISGEGIVRLSAQSLDNMRRILLQHVDEVRVFAYVREPVGYSASALQQRIKGGYAGTELSRPEYRAKFQRLIRVFGAAHFTTREFSRSTLLNGSVVADFCDLWGIPFDSSREVRVNESLAEPALKLLYLFNRSCAPSLGEAKAKHARRALTEALIGHFKGKFELPVRFHAAAIDRQDVAWLRNQCGITFRPRAAPGTAADDGGLDQYLQSIEPEVMASYRQLLGSLGIASSDTDSAVDLLNRHARHYLAPPPLPPSRPPPPPPTPQRKAGKPSTAWQRFKAWLR